MNINIGIIGTGLIGLTHLFSLKKIEEGGLLSDNDVHIKIRGVADPDEEKLNRLKLKNTNNIDYFTTNRRRKYLNLILIHILLLRESFYTKM